MQLSHEAIKQAVKSYIPLDKSWIIRLGFLDLIRGFIEDISKFLDSQPQNELGTDLKSLREVARGWQHRYALPLDVGESGTIYRGVQFYRWLNNILHEPIKSKTLIERSEKYITNNPLIVTWTPEQLRELDHKTSQWATMQYLFEHPSRRRKSKPLADRGEKTEEDVDFKLRVTYDAVDHWEKQRAKGEVWVPRTDPTLWDQSVAFVEGLLTGKVNYVGQQPEDCCFELAFGLTSVEEARRRYPSVEGHETSRFDEMQKVIAEVDSGKPICSKDHRVVQAMIERQLVKGIPVKVADWSMTSKTWPEFEKFIRFALEFAGKDPANYLLN
ncbi:hypothetical protein KA107_02800 [Candidatus Pacearchaeota archaeon]|nr:hypothetical protein [Candidatus Pacearchaeota archaeon]